MAKQYHTTADPKAWADGVPVYCSHDAIVDPATLVPNSKNPNRHPDSQIQLLGRVIRGNGWRQPITVSNRSGFIVKGHGRLAAAMLEGFKAVPVDYQNYASEAEEYADLVADNRLAELAELDRKALADIFNDIDFSEMPVELTGYTEDEAAELAAALNDALEEELQGDPDEVPEPPEPQDIVTRLGDLWQIGRHRLLCGDSTDKATVERLMDGERADMVFTDPPYGYKYQSNGRKKTAKFEVLLNDDKVLDFMPRMKEICKGFVFVCTTWKTLDEWLPLFKKYYELSNMIIWDKGGGGIGDLEHTFSTDYEIILCANNGAKITGKRIGSVWDISKDNPNSYAHPTQKPVALSALAIENTTNRSDVVADLFGGSGSTLIACQQLGRSCRMMELEPKYCDVIVRRYIRTTGNTADIHLIREGKEIDRAEYAAIFEE